MSGCVIEKTEDLRLWSCTCRSWRTSDHRCGSDCRDREPEGDLTVGGSEVGSWKPGFRHAVVPNQKHCHHSTNITAGATTVRVSWQYSGSVWWDCVCSLGFPTIPGSLQFQWPYELPCSRIRLLVLCIAHGSARINFHYHVIIAMWGPRMVQTWMSYSRWLAWPLSTWTAERGTAARDAGTMHHPGKREPRPGTGAYFNLTRSDARTSNNIKHCPSLAIGELRHK